jgi:formylmethanofuran dehydrogenase subunit B
MTENAGAATEMGAAKTLLLTCPCCGLGCDDLARGADGVVDARGCAIAERHFARGKAASLPHAIAGAPASYGEAVAAAAALLSCAHHPWFGGLGADLNGIRGLLALADRTGGVAEHHASKSLMRNYSVVQSEGWMVSTFSEIANRADLIVIVGDDQRRSFPRFYERLVRNANALYRDAAPEVVLLAPATETPLDTSITRHIIVSETELLGQVGALLALIQGRVWRSKTPPADDLADLAAKLKSAHYGVVVWSAGALPGAQPDLIVELLAEIVRSLNVTTRAAGLPLGGIDNAIGSVQALAWQTGFPARVAYKSSGPDHDPYLFAGERAAGAGEIDLLVWTSAIGAVQPPDYNCPIIALVPSDMELSLPTAVTIRVGIPAVDHAGNISRSDGVVALPVAALNANTNYPTVAEASAAILAGLTARVRP